MAFRTSRGQRRVAALLLASCAVAALMDSAAFLAGLPGHRAAGRPLELLGQGRAPAQAVREAPLAAWCQCLPAAALAGACAAALSAKEVGRKRHVCHLFFGGKKGEKTEGEADGEEAPADEEGESGEEVLSDAAKLAIAGLQEEVEELKEVAEEKKTAHDRLKLEFDNFRERTRNELNAARGQAAVPLIKELLPIADEYDLAQQNLKIETDGQKAIVARYSELYEKMMGIWKGLGVEKLETVGQDFDPELHEAISMLPSADYGPEVVMNEMRGGWVLKAPGSDSQQVLRASLVIVSSGPGPS